MRISESKDTSKLLILVSLVPCAHARVAQQHIKEAPLIGAHAIRGKELGFFHCWTRKEAFIKALGDGLRYPLDVFDVSLSPREPARILRVGNMDGNDCGWCLRSFIPTPGYVAAIVIERSRAATNDAAFLNGPACRLWTR